jgi:hypothetical protein
LDISSVSSPLTPPSCSGIQMYVYFKCCSLCSCQRHGTLCTNMKPCFLIEVQRGTESLRETDR